MTRAKNPPTVYEETAPLPAEFAFGSRLFLKLKEGSVPLIGAATFIPVPLIIAATFILGTAIGAATFIPVPTIRAAITYSFILGQHS